MLLRGIAALAGARHVAGPCGTRAFPGLSPVERSSQTAQEGAENELRLLLIRKGPLPIDRGLRSIACTREPGGYGDEGEKGRPDLLQGFQPAVGSFRFQTVAGGKQHLIETD